MFRNSLSGYSSWIYHHRYAFFIGLILFGYGLNLFVDIMEIDAAQYAEISREMTVSGSYLEVYFRGEDYLDKPPLLFWISSIGISLFGNTNIGYKLFPVLLLVFSLYATYRFARLWYDQRVATLAAVLLGSTQAYSLMSNDIRTDGLLTAFVIISVWLLSEYLLKGKIQYILLSGLSIGAAMLAKGPLGFFIPMIAIGGHLLLTRQWKKIVNPVWLLLLPGIVLMLAPMCYGLYMQFDLHPEKEVYGLKGPSGLGFYFWTQSFGRITGDSAWNNNTPWYFFLQSMLWDLTPWILLFIPSIWNRFKDLFQRRQGRWTQPEWISLSGFILPLVALSFSGYKLPHYIFPLFPFAAVIIAARMVSFADALPRWVEYLQLLFIHLLLIAGLLIITWVFPVKSAWLPLLLALFAAGVWWWRSQAQDTTDRLILPTLMGVLAFQWILSLHFYPRLLQYQAGSQAGKFIKSENPAQVYLYDECDFAMEYYSGQITPNAFGTLIDSLSPGAWVYVSDKAYPSMPPHKVIRVFDHFPPTRVSPKFLNPATRPEKLRKMYLIELIDKK